MILLAIPSFPATPGPCKEPLSIFFVGPLHWPCQCPGHADILVPVWRKGCYWPEIPDKQGNSLLLPCVWFQSMDKAVSQIFTREAGQENVLPILDMGSFASWIFHSLQMWNYDFSCKVADSGLHQWLILSFCMNVGSLCPCQWHLWVTTLRKVTNKI